MTVVPSSVDCTWAYGVCSSNWCGLCLGLWSLLEFWGRAGHGEDEEVGGVGGTVDSLRSRIQGMVAVCPAGLSQPSQLLHQGSEPSGGTGAEMGVAGHRTGGSLTGCG